MKIKMLFIAIAVFALTSTSFAQGFAAVLYTESPLTDRCDGSGAPLLGGCLGTVYWDANGNGPDPLDAPPVVGNGFGQANWNQFDMQSGIDNLGVEGTFFTDPAFTISTNVPALSQYYVVIECGGVRWTLRVFQIVAGPSDVDLAQGWTCEVTSVPCDEPTQVGIHTVGGRNFVANGPYYECIRLCAGTTTLICLGPLAADERPHALVIPGCSQGLPGCDIECPPALFGYDDAGWVYNPTNGTWCNIIVSQNDGCVCFCLETIESAIDVNFSATSLDAKVELLWTAASESNMARYDVMRRSLGQDNFSKVGEVSVPIV